MMSDLKSQEPFDPAKEELIDTSAVFAGEESAGEKPTDEEHGVDSAGRQTSIRVHVSLLDSLMTLAGELVLSRNQLLQTISAGGLKSAEAVGQRIDLITSELQEAIMLTRMQPIGNVFGKLPRIVRDLAARLDKQVDLSIFGKEVELDKTIIEAIGDPLTHLVRNAVVHGIEPPELRRQLGKPEAGSVVLRAFHEAGQVVIEIEDDGAGLDSEQLASLALRQGLVTAEQVQSMSDKEKMNLVFQPGFSSADTVTEVSGRGVGMDVVKSNFDKLGGQIDITSETGKGTAISIKLPLTLAIIPCQVILTEGERYAIPQVNLEELLRIPAHLAKERIEIVGSAEVVRLRGKLLPLVRLADALGIERTYTDPDDGNVKIDRRRRIADRRSKQSP
ncbi:chemotaxis protein CheA, partial [bacterium]|nr:chemotaxis protein CheA [bacterium]